MEIKKYDEMGRLIEVIEIESNELKVEFDMSTNEMYEELIQETGDIITGTLTIHDGSNVTFKSEPFTRYNVEYESQRNQTIDLNFDGCDFEIYDYGVHVEWEDENYFFCFPHEIEPISFA